MKRILFLIFAFAVIAAGCSDGDAAEPTTTQPQTTTTAEPAASSSTTTVPTTTTTSTTTTTVAPTTTTGGIVPGEDADVDAVVLAYQVAFSSTTTYEETAPYLTDPTGLEETVENPFLERFYRDGRSAALPAQMFFLFARARQIEDLRQSDLFARVRVADYLFAKDRLFAELNLDADELALYDQVAANLAVYFAFCQPGDPIMGLALDHGGHLTHGWDVSITGSFFEPIRYQLNPETHLIDYDMMRDLALKHNPKVIVAGATAYPRIIDFERIAAIAHAGADVFVAGSATGPETIDDSIAQGKAAAMAALEQRQVAARLVG